MKLFYCGKSRQNFASNATGTPVSVPAKITWYYRQFRREKNVDRAIDDYGKDVGPGAV